MFLETSALTGENVEEAFLKCARTILNKIESGNPQSCTRADLFPPDVRGRGGGQFWGRSHPRVDVSLP